jgi:hypothetical protein
VTGNYTQTANGELSEQWGSVATLNVNLNATLSGFLVVHYDFKNPPKSGATYTVMTFGSLSGAFTNVSPGTAKYTNHSRGEILKRHPSTAPERINSEAFGPEVGFEKITIDLLQAPFGAAVPDSVL